MVLIAEFDWFHVFEEVKILKKIDTVHSPLSLQYHYVMTRWRRHLAQ